MSALPPDPPRWLREATERVASMPAPARMSIIGLVATAFDIGWYQGVDYGASADPVIALLRDAVEQSVRARTASSAGAKHEDPPEGRDQSVTHESMTGVFSPAVATTAPPGFPTARAWADHPANKAPRIDADLSYEVAAPFTDQVAIACDVCLTPWPCRDHPMSAGRTVERDTPVHDAITTDSRGAAVD